MSEGAPGRAGLVDWREWGAGAFAEAREKDRLILLDISAVWCHWCHVMDKTSYSDPDAAGIINGRFVPVRVDTDRMPDVNERYNMGGWPTTAVMLPSGEVLLGATYMPPDKLKETLDSIDKFYHENRDALMHKVAELNAKKAAEREETLSAQPGEITGDIKEYVLTELDKAFDPVHGGFGDAPKFPMPEAMDLLLGAYRDTGRKAYLEMAVKTLDGMSSYGMYDHVMGGFFRYSVTQDWTVPHYEKMLGDNAGLIINCVNAYRVTGEERYIDTVRKTLDYVDKRLWADEGYFRGSQDADEEYYKLPLEGRQKLRPPYVDRTMFTNLNARMAVSYLTAWEALGEAAYMDKAVTALRFILTNMKGEGGGLYHYYDGEPRRYRLLTDQSAAVRALLHAHQVTGEKTWLDETLSLVSFMDKVHWDNGSGGYFDLPEDPGAVGALAQRTKPMSENAEMSRSLAVLHILTGDGRYREMAGKCLLNDSKSCREYGYMASGYALAVDFYLNAPLAVTLVGDTGAGDMVGLLMAALSVFVPRRVLRVLDYVRDKDGIKAAGYHASGHAAAYICKGPACTARIEDPDVLKARLLKDGVS